MPLGELITAKLLQRWLVEEVIGPDVGIVSREPVGVGPRDILAGGERRGHEAIQEQRLAGRAEQLGRLHDRRHGHQSGASLTDECPAGVAGLP